MIRNDAVYTMFIKPICSRCIAQQVHQSKFSSWIHHLFQKISTLNLELEKKIKNIFSSENKKDSSKLTFLSSNKKAIPKDLLDDINDFSLKGIKSEKVIPAKHGTAVAQSKSHPNIMIKRKRNEEEAVEYVDRVVNAKKIVKENKLNMLEVPKARVIEVNEEWFVLEEKIDLIHDDFHQIKGLYKTLFMHSADTMDTRIQQLVHFICATNFSDVKYDNIPLSKGGKIALIDLDNHDSLAGLTTSQSRRQKDGLLYNIPLKNLDKTVGFAKRFLKPHQESFLKKYTENIIKPRSEKIERNRERYEVFAENNDLDSTKPLEIDPQDHPCVQEVKQAINTQIEQNSNLDLKVGRKVILSKSNYPSENILNDLCQSGQIFSFKTDPYDRDKWIVQA